MRVSSQTHAHRFDNRRDSHSCCYCRAYVELFLAVRQSSMLTRRRRRRNVKAKGKTEHMHSD